MKSSGVVIKNIRELFKIPTVLAPMAGYTDSAFRSVCKDYNCGMTVTEMVSSRALVMGNKLTQTLLLREKNDSCCAVQIFGHEPEVMAESVKLLNMHSFAAVDINMGCPVKKVVSGGDGSALLENPALAGKIITAVKNAANCFVTVKIRLGVNDGKNAVNFTKMCQDTGADLITVHFRTRKQMYSGQADFTLLPQIAAAVNIPVVANGDVESREKMLLLQNMGAFAVAVGRGALGRPYIFNRLIGEPYTFDMVKTLVRHIQLISSAKPPLVAANEMKKHIAFYLKGIRGAKTAVTAVQYTNDTALQLKIVEDFAVSLPANAE